MKEDWEGAYKIIEAAFIKSQKKLNIATSTLEWYSSRRIYERLSQFDGDNELSKCSDMAKHALKEIGDIK